MKTKLLTVLMITAHFIGLAQEKEKTYLFDSALTVAFEKAQNVTPSISVAIVNGGQIIYNKTLGYADLENKIKATNNTKYYIASLTKSYIGVLASKLHHENKIDIFKPITTYLKDSFNDEEIYNHPISVQSLLTHTSGLRNNALTMRTAFTGVTNKVIMTNLLYRYTTYDGEIDGVYSYDNLGYNIFSVLLREELAKDWKKMLHEQIFKPLELKNTTTSASEANKLTVAKSYMPGVEGPEEVYLQKEDNTMHSAGGIYTTTGDVAHWLLYNMNAKKSAISSEVFNYATQVLVKIDSVSRSAEPFEINGYGLGWKTGTYKGNGVIYHSGAFAGSFAHASFMPEKQLGIVIFTNEIMLGGELSKLLLSIFYDIYTNEWNKDDIKNTIDRIESMANSFPSHIKNYRANLAQRKWILSLEKENYLGVYSNEAYGEISIEQYAGEWVAIFGNMQSKLTAYKYKDSARAEFVPLSGEVLQFRIIRGEVKGVEYDGELFIKK